MTNPRDRDYRQENVLEHTVTAFADTVGLSLEHLRRFIARGSNPALTGAYVEEVVRGFIREWIGHRRLVHGTFYSAEFQASGEKPMQVDGIVYDPTSGPPILRQGDFAVVHPAFCTSVIEIKTSWSPNLMEFEERLQRIYALYMHHVTKTQVMGVVIGDPDPAKKASIPLQDGTFMPAHHYSNASWCPIFVLFKEDNGEYSPYRDAIEAMIRAIYSNQYSAGNYM